VRKLYRSYFEDKTHLKLSKLGVVKIPVDNDDDDHYEKMITAIKSNYVTVITVSLPQMLVFADFMLKNRN